MLRIASACMALAVTAGVARADTGTLPNGATLDWPRLFLRIDDELIEPPDPETFRHHLNLGACQCSQQGAGDTDLYYELHLTATTGISPTGQLWVGTQCDDDINRPMNCRQVGDVGDLDALAISEDNFPVRLYDLINARPDQEGLDCRAADNGDATVWVISDTDDDSQPDFFSPRPIDLGLFTDVVGFDTKPPPLPTSITASGGEESIELSWDPPVSNATDVFGYQVLCMDADGNPVGDGATPLYATTEQICDLPDSTSLSPTVIVTEDGSDVAAAPEPFTRLDPAFICKTEENGTASGTLVKGLKNEQEYTIALVAVDFYGNPTGTFLTRTIVPHPVTDFWEDLHDRGSEVEGGFCSTSAPAGWVTMLGILGAAWAFGRRRRRGAARIVAAGVVALALAPRTARADDFLPYWEDPAASDPELGAAGPKWHAGIKLGPYTPAIDDQIGVNPSSGMGPYQAMFGNYFLDGEPVDSHVYQVLPVLDVDRYIWTLSGQLAVGGSIGYMQKSAYAYVDGSSPDDPRRPRSAAGRNTFRLIPLALTATYRATQLDDLYGIPVVPYVRAGLSYYVWWLDGPNGDISKLCKDGSTDTMDCDANKAYGGSLGVQGTVGLAVRAERIDADAARSMVNSGIYHAGFYVEYLFAKVDGFGSDSKLSVGDNTWFAGVDFEF